MCFYLIARDEAAVKQLRVFRRVAVGLAKAPATDMAGPFAHTARAMLLTEFALEHANELVSVVQRGILVK